VAAVDGEHERRVRRASRAEAAFAWPTSIAALTCLPVVLAPLVVDSEGLRRAAGIADWAIWAVFALEVAVVLPLVPDRAAWLRHHRLLLFILIAAFPGFAFVFRGVGLDGMTPALLIAQKLLKLAKVDGLVRRRKLHLPFGRWLLLAPAVVAEVLVWLKLGWVSGVILAAALLLGLIGPGGRPDPTAPVRLAARVRGRIAPPA
jgi:hypothetical protein